MANRVILWIFSFAGVLVIGIFFVLFQGAQDAPIRQGMSICFTVNDEIFDFHGRVRSSFEAKAAMDDFMNKWEFRDSVISYTVSSIFTFQKNINVYEIGTTCVATQNNPNAQECLLLGQAGVTEDGQICRVV